MKLGNVVTSLPALQKLAAETLTPKTLYRVSKLLSKLDGEVSFFNDERAKIFKELGKERENDQWEIAAENREEYEKKMNDLLNVDIETDFKVVQIPVSETMKMSYNDLRMLDGFVELFDPDDADEAN